MIDVSLVFGLLAFVYFQFSNLTSREFRQIYDRGPQWIPEWVFGPVWSILYLGIFFSGYYAFTSIQDTQFYVSMLTLYIINLFLNKQWTVFFFDNENVGQALLTILFIDATGAIVLILMGLSDLWLSFGLYCPYIVWLVLATILNFQWWCAPKQEDIEQAILPTQMKRYPAQAPRLPRRGLLKKV